MPKFLTLLSCLLFASLASAQTESVIAPIWGRVVAPGDGQGLIYNATTGEWENQNIPGGGSGGVGAEISYTSPTGTVDPSITGFVAGIGSNGTGRIKITLTANTSWQGLPAGTDGQTLSLTVVSGAFTFTLLARDGSTALQQIMASGNFVLAQYDSIGLIYSSSLAQWVLQT
jgi:hypothetical protein